MVAALVALRFRVLANTLSRNPLQLVVVIAGAVQAVVVLGFVVIGLIFLGFSAPPIQHATIVIGGLVLTLGWLVLPVLATGIEPTLDPAKLAAFPIPVGRLMVAMTVVGASWIPGIITLLVSFATALTWRQTPVAAGAALACGVVATLICIVGSRLTSALTANLLASRRLRDRAAVLVVAAVVLLGPVALALALGLPTADPFPRVAMVLGATPFGAIWSVPGLLASGHGGSVEWAIAALEFAMAVVTLALMVVLWRNALLSSTRYRGFGGAVQLGAGRLGVFRWVRATPAGAIAARSLVYWRRDPRFTRQLILVPLLPALLMLLSRLDNDTWMLSAAAPVVAGLLPLTLFGVVSYDGTAFALHLTTGVRGVDDRIGRAAALLAFAVPSVAVIAVAALGLGGLLGAPGHLAAVLGISLGVLLSGLAVSSVSSASLVVPVPRAGRNPFGAAPGSGMTSVLASYLVSAVTVGLAVPELVVGIWGMVTHSALLGWITLGVGLLWGAASLLVGVRLGGRILDRSGPALLARMRRTGG